MAHLELTDEQTEALIRELALIIEYDRYRLKSPYQGSEGDPWDDAAGARSAGTAAPATTLRAAEQRPTCTAKRLGHSRPLQ
jgi:hypothetical protein